MTTTPRIGAPELEASQAIPETTVNEQVRFLEQGAAHFIFKDRDLAAPPGSPADGDCYLVASASTGDWAGHEDEIAFRLATAWNFIVPVEGFTAWVNDEDQFIVYDGVSWSNITGSGGGALLAANNLSDVANAATARTNLGLGGAAVLSLADLDERARDALGTALVAGPGITITPNDGSDTITISASSANPVESIIVACSDEATALTAGAGKVTFRMPYAFTLSAVRASLTTAQTSGSILTVDINEGGASILSTKLTIDNNEKTSTTAATAAVISDSSLADDAEITVDIDQVGDGTAKGLKVVLIGSRP